MTNTENLIETIKKYGKVNNGMIQEKEGKKYMFVTYYIQTPYLWLVELFKKATKENNGQFGSFKNGNNSFNCAMPRFKNEPAGIMSVKILILL